jgi:hypothetical protein
MIHAFETGFSLAAPSVVASATDKRPRMARNPAGTPSMESTGEIGISSEQKAVRIDRRVSVAPVMDWTDEVRLAL